MVHSSGIILSPLRTENCKFDQIWHFWGSCTQPFHWSGSNLAHESRNVLFYATFHLAQLSCSLWGAKNWPYFEWM